RVERPEVLVCISVPADPPTATRFPLAVERSAKAPELGPACGANSLRRPADSARATVPCAPTLSSPAWSSESRYVPSPVALRKKGDAPAVVMAPAAYVEEFPSATKRLLATDFSATQRLARANTDAGWATVARRPAAVALRSPAAAPAPAA